MVEMNRRKERKKRIPYGMMNFVTVPYKGTEMVVCQEV